MADLERHSREQHSRHLDERHIHRFSCPVKSCLRGPFNRQENLAIHIRNKHAGINFTSPEYHATDPSHLPGISVTDSIPLPKISKSSPSLGPDSFPNITASVKSLAKTLENNDYADHNDTSLQERHNFERASAARPSDSGYIYAERGSNSDHSKEISDTASTGTDKDDLIQLSSIKGTILETIRNKVVATITAHSKPRQLSHATLRIDWNPIAFLKEQYHDADFRGIGEVITITGSDTNAQAATVAEYMRQTWLTTGDEVWRGFETAINRQKDTQDDDITHECNSTLILTSLFSS